MESPAIVFFYEEYIFKVFYWISAFFLLFSVLFRFYFYTGNTDLWVFAYANNWLIYLNNKTIIFIYIYVAIFLKFFFHTYETLDDISWRTLIEYDLFF